MAAVMNHSRGIFAALRSQVRKCVLMSFLASLIVAVGFPAFAATNGNNDNELERGVKAAFLYKFLSYIEWPSAVFPKPDSPFVIGVTGADTVAAELAQIARGRTVDNRPVTVRRIEEKDPISGLHLLFIGRSAAARQPQLLAVAQQNPIVTVTETEDALAHGSVINFKLSDGRVRFEVSLAAAEKSDLKLSSRLLAVASSVHGTRR
jgi:hypothetical protein